MNTKSIIVAAACIGGSLWAGSPAAQADPAHMSPLCANLTGFVRQACEQAAASAPGQQLQAEQPGLRVPGGPVSGPADPCAAPAGNNETACQNAVRLDCLAGAGGPACAPGGLPAPPPAAPPPPVAPPPPAPAAPPPPPVNIPPPGVIPGDSPPPAPPLGCFVGVPCVESPPAPMSPGPVASWPEGNAADCANDVYAAHFNLFCAAQPGNVVATTPYANGTPLDNPQLKPGGPGS